MKKYVIEYRKVGSAGSQKEEKQTLDITLWDLEPHTEYHVSLTVHNSYEQSRTSEYKMITTPEGS